MGLNLQGYVLEGARVGSSNSPDTFSPNLLEGSGFSFFPSDESLPEHGYLLLCTGGGKLTFASFGWVKSDTLPRFGYDGKKQSFFPLPGSTRKSLGELTASANTDRLRARPPVSSDLVTYPLRVVVGTHAPIVSVVSVFSFPYPPADTVEVSDSTGELHWASDLLATYEGQGVFVNEQTFTSDSLPMGEVGPDLYLSPIPTTGYKPLVRIGYRSYLVAYEVPDESSFPVLFSGEVAWARDTGRLAFAASDITDYAGIPVYYDGVLNADGLTLSPVSMGVVTFPFYSSLPLFPVPPPGGDILISVGVTIFPETRRVTTHSATVPVGVVEIDDAGVAKFSPEDANSYMGFNITATVCDLELEHGVTFRLFRSLTDPSLSGSSNDVTSLVSVTDQKWAEPIGQSPLIFPPTIPLEDQLVTLRVVQGSGSYLSDDFPRLDRLPPGDPYAGLGYFWKESEGTLYFGVRRKDQLFALSEATSTLSFGDPSIQVRGLLLEKETAVGSGIFNPLVVGQDAIFDPLSATVSFGTTYGSLVLEGTAGTLAGNTFTDLTNPFGSVAPGDDLIFNGSLFRVTGVVSSSVLSLGSISPGSTSGAYEIRRSPEVVADHVWQVVPTGDPFLIFTRTRVLGSISNSPRLSVDPSEVGRFSVLFSDSSVSSAVTLVSSFTDPNVLPTQEVEVNALGELNFSTSKVILGGGVKVKVTQRPGEDFRVTPALGFFDVTFRFFEGETGEVTYRDANLVSRTEPVTFLQRKVTLPHPIPTDTIQIPLNGKTLASAPVPSLYRSGRPVVAEKDYSISGSIVTFLPSSQVTKAFPSGVPVGVAEPVLADFYVLEANGGEKTFTTLFPVYSPPVQSLAGESSFTLPGDLSGQILVNSFLRLDRAEVVEVASVNVSVDNNTVVTTFSPFREDRSNPYLEVCAPLSATPPLGSRPQLVLTPFLLPSPKGNNSLSFVGDLTSQFRTGTVLSLRLGVDIRDSYLVSGSKVVDGLTQVTLTTTLLREVSGSFAVWRSATPVSERGTSKFSLFKAPVNGVVALYRNGEDVSSSVDGSGNIALDTPLLAGEELVALYLGQEILPAGLNIRATYVAAVSPDSSNGLLDQKLRADFSLRNWDSFYARVVPVSQFKEEVAQELKDAAKGNTSGPITENVSSPTLATQGAPSLFWSQRHLENSDVAARAYLLYYHSLCRGLSGVIKASYGVVPGLQDGSFEFDGSTGNTASSVLAADNQIDDLILVAPTRTTPAYLAGAQSRFFPSFRKGYGESFATTTDGEPIVDLGLSSVLSVSGLRTRLAWGRVVQDSADTDNFLVVDEASGSPTASRPAFQVGYKCVVQKEDGTFLIPASAPIEVSLVGVGSLTFTAPLGVAVPSGSTVYRSPSDDSAVSPEVVTHQVNRDFTLDGANGLVLYKAPEPPYDGSDPLVPPSLQAKPIPSNTLLSWGASAPSLDDFPYRFPALDGLPADDDGEVPFPVLSPASACEVNELGLGLLPAEDSTLDDILSLTYPTSTFTVDIDPTGTVLALPFGLWPVVGPRPQDLVRILTGVDAGTTYYRIISTTASSVTLDPLFPLTGSQTGVDITFTLDTDISSTGDILLFGSALSDASAPFTPQDVGKSVVILSGVDTGKRRQIVSYISPTLVGISPSLTLAVGIDYRKGSALATYGGSNSLVDTPYGTIYSQLLTQYSLINDFFLAFFAGLFTVHSTGSADVTVFDSLVDPLANFNNLPASSYIFIQSGPNKGIFPVDTVLSATSLLIGFGTPAFFLENELGVGYSVVTFNGITQTQLYQIVGYWLTSAQAVTDLTTFHDLLTATVTVNTSDSIGYATAILSSDVANRISAIASRITDVQIMVAALNAFLKNAPGWYNLRYAWIVTRIHRVTGLLPRISAARASRDSSVTLLQNNIYITQSLLWKKRRIPPYLRHLNGRPWIVSLSRIRPSRFFVYPRPPRNRKLNA